MADPLTIVGTAGALIRNEWKDADLTLLSLSAQLSALRAALAKIEEWIGSDEGEPDRQLLKDLGLSTDCCKILLGKLYELISGLRLDRGQQLAFHSKVKLVFGNRTIEDIQKLLEQQTSAMTLLLTACNCRTLGEQKALLDRSSTRTVFHQMNQDSASMIVHRDADSIATRITDNLSKLSLSFTFDRDVFASRPYERFIRRFTKDSLRIPQPPGPDIQQTRNIQVKNVPLQHGPRLLMFCAEGNTTDQVLHGMKYFNQEDMTTSILGSSLQRPAVYRYVITNAKAMVLAVQETGTEFEEECNLDNRDMLLSYADDLVPDMPLDVRVGGAIRSIWQDPGMSRVVMAPQEFDLMKSARYFFDDIDRISSPDYTPTITDIGRVQDKTPAVIELRVDRRSQCHLIDVTLRFMQPDIIYDFDNITSVMFYVNLADYNKILRREPLETPLTKSKSYFAWAINSRWFPWGKPILLLLRGSNILESKLNASPFAEYYPRYKYANNSGTVLSFIRGRFDQPCPVHFSPWLAICDDKSIQAPKAGGITVDLLLEILRRLELLRVLPCEARQVARQRSGDLSITILGPLGYF
ncbi:G-protein alpha subunit-domain-containing protein [Aspergillus californicus]